MPTFFQQATTYAGLLKGPIFALVTGIVLWICYKAATPSLKKYLLKRANSKTDVKNFLLAWRYAWLTASVILVIVSLSGSLASLGISAAFLGMILGWSLQAPVTGIAAWLMIILKRPFKIGDRVIINGIIGDVMDITLTHVILDQVGGTIGGEEKSGRGVLIPNGILFNQIIYNYTFSSKYILDEVTVLVTYESDMQEAERVVLSSAEEVTRDIVKKTKEKPFIRLELADSGIRIRLMYKTLALGRQEISTNIIHTLIAKFNKNDKIEFAYPHTEILYRPEKT